jgi:hypothetical protein
MFTLYKDINTPICWVSDELEVFPLEGRNKPAGIDMLLSQVIREINPTGGSLRCVDLDTSEVLTLQELVTNNLKEGCNLEHPDVQARIDHYRRCDVTERLIAKEFGTYAKRLQRVYPRRMSVDRNSIGRRL